MSNSIGVIMIRAHATSQVLQGHVKQILGLDFSPNGVNLASGSDDHTVRNNNTESSNSNNDSSNSNNNESSDNNNDSSNINIDSNTSSSSSTPSSSHQQQR